MSFELFLAFEVEPKAKTALKGELENEQFSCNYAIVWCEGGKLVPHNFRAAPDLQLATLYNDTNV